MTVKPSVERYICAEDCVGATTVVFKDAVENVLQKGFLDV
jgi:hypothetical protein